MSCSYAVIVLSFCVISADARLCFLHHSSTHCIALISFCAARLISNCRDSICSFSLETVCVLTCNWDVADRYFSLNSSTTLFAQASEPTDVFRSAFRAAYLNSHASRAAVLVCRSDNRSRTALATSLSNLLTRTSQAAFSPINKFRSWIAAASPCTCSLRQASRH